MIKLKFTIVFLIVSLLNLPVFAQDKGFVWLPMGFHIVAQNQTKEYKIKNVKFIIKDKFNNNEIYWNLRNSSGNKKEYPLNKKNNRLSFYSDKLFMIPVGLYEIKSVNFDVVINKNNTRNVSVELFNVFFNKKNEKSVFKIQSKTISLYPSLSLEYKILELDEKSENNNFTYDLIDDESIPIINVLNYVKKNKNKFKNYQPNIVLADPLLPPMQMPGYLLNSKKSHYLGMIVDVACDLDGDLKFVWTKENDPIQYTYLLNINTMSKMCKEDLILSQKFHLPHGKWSLLSMTFYSHTKNNNKYETSVLKSKNSYAKKYYEINEKKFTEMNVNERVLMKIIELTLDKKPDSSGVYFLGTSEIRKNEDKNSSENFQIFFKRDYEIIEIRKVFSVKKAYNAYTGELMRRDRVIGSIQLIVDFIGSENSAKLMEKYIKELKSFSIRNMGRCIFNEEKQDPLVELNGDIFVKGNKNKRVLNEVIIDDIKFKSEGKSHENIKKCIVKSINKFRFSRPLKLNFQANIRLESL